MGFIFMSIVRWLFHNSAPAKVDKYFRRLQLLSAASYSLGHGGNDAQKTMGIIAILLFTSGNLGPVFYVPFWVVLACHAAMGLGTLTGGWRIVKTMGQKITHLQPVGGFCAETAGAVMLFTATFLGVPVSTTHTITGSIIGNLLLVLGAANDTVFHPNEIEATARAYHTQPVIFPNMAHDMMVEAGWQAVADKIIAWLGERGI